MSDEKDPVPNEQVRAYLEGQTPREPFWERDITDLRREYREESIAAGGIPESLAVIEDVITAGVPGRIYRPLGDESDVLVWLHGGAWMVGDLDSYDAVVRALANRAECAVLSVDYRLAPEDTYPAAVEDSWTAARWAADHFDAVAVGGDSSGGNLSAAVALRARDCRLELALQLLVYPVLDSRADSSSYNAYRERYQRFAGVEGFGAQSQAGIRHIWEIYVPDPARRREPDASPLRAASFVGMAPALIITAEHDILRDEGHEYARRLKSAGGLAELVDYKGQIHNFFRLPAVMDDAQDAISRSATALRHAFSRPRSAPQDTCRGTA